MTRKHLALILWLLGILLPMAWFTRFSAAYNRFFQYAFTPLWTHVLMHAFLFAVLAYLLAHLLPSWGPRVVRGGVGWQGGVLVLVLVVAWLQEGFQLLYKGRPPGMDEFRDVAIDLIGASLGLLLFWQRARK